MKRTLFRTNGSMHQIDRMQDMTAVCLMPSTPKSWSAPILNFSLRSNFSTAARRPIFITFCYVGSDL
jgi:hypothetical protein